jgi:hypothetical protein
VAPFKLREHFLLLLASRISAQYANRPLRVRPLWPLEHVVRQSINASGTPPVPRHWPQPDVSFVKLRGLDEVLPSGTSLDRLGEGFELRDSLF